MDEISRVRDLVTNASSNVTQDPSDNAPKLEASTDAGGDMPPRLPRSFGFDLQRLNTEFALVLMGSKTVILRERDNGPIEDRVRILSLDAFRAWYSNRFTEVFGKDKKICSVTFAEAWLRHRSRRQFDGLEFHPDPARAAGTPGYFNLWRGFAVRPKAKQGGYSIFKDHLLNNVCEGNQALYAWVSAGSLIPSSGHVSGLEPLWSAAAKWGLGKPK